MGLARRGVWVGCGGRVRIYEGKSEERYGDVRPEAEEDVHGVANQPEREDGDRQSVAPLEGVSTEELRYRPTAVLCNASVQPLS